MISSPYADIPVVSYITSEPSFLSLSFSLSDLPGLIMFRHCLLFISPRLCSLPAAAHTQYIAPLFNNNGVPLVNSRDNCAGEAVLICHRLIYCLGLARQGMGMALLYCAVPANAGLRRGNRGAIFYLLVCRLICADAHQKPAWCHQYVRS